MERFPIIITLGGALLGYLAGEMFVTDPAVAQRLGAPVPHLVANIAGGIGAVVVVAVGMLMRRRSASNAAA